MPEIYNSQDMKQLSHTFAIAELVYCMYLILEHKWI